MDVLKVAEEKAVLALRKMELEGQPHTRLPGWPMVKHGFLSGFKNGVMLGFNMGTTARDFHDSKDPVPEPDPAQPELPIPACDMEGDLL